MRAMFLFPCWFCLAEIEEDWRMLANHETIDAYLFFFEEIDDGNLDFIIFYLSFLFIWCLRIVG